MLLGNTVAVHAACLLNDPNASFADSALLTLTHSLPQRATGQAISVTKMVAAHKEAWRATQIADSPMLSILTEPDPLRRALVAMRLNNLRKAEFSSIVLDSLLALPSGGKHALAFELFEGGTAGRLVASVAEQCAAWYAIVATPQNVHETVAARSTRHRVWQHLVARLAPLAPEHPETPLVTNLLCGLYAQGELATEQDVETAFDSWSSARRTLAPQAAGR